MTTESQKRRAAQAAAARQKLEGQYKQEHSQESKPALAAQAAADETFRKELIEDSRL